MGEQRRKRELKYFASHLSELPGNAEGGISGWVVAVFGTFWAMLGQHFEGFVISNPVFWVTAFWALDLFLGSWLAWKESRFSPTRAARSALKWLLWMSVLAVAWGVRDSGFFGSAWMAAIVEGSIILAEGSSVIRNAAALSDNPRAKRLLSKFADAADQKLDELEKRIARVEEEKKVGKDGREQEES